MEDKKRPKSQGMKDKDMPILLEERRIGLDKPKPIRAREFDLMGTKDEHSARRTFVPQHLTSSFVTSRHSMFGNYHISLGEDFNINAFMKYGVVDIKALKRIRQVLVAGRLQKGNMCFPLSNYAQIGPFSLLRFAKKHRTQNFLKVLGWRHALVPISNMPFDDIALKIAKCLQVDSFIKKIPRQLREKIEKDSSEEEEAPILQEKGPKPQLSESIPVLISDHQPTIDNLTVSPPPEETIHTLIRQGKSLKNIYEELCDSKNFKAVEYFANNLESLTAVHKLINS